MPTKPLRTLFSIYPFQISKGRWLYSVLRDNVFNFLWHLQVISSLLEPQAEIPLEDSCVQFKVEVRRKRLNGSGYWSDWSSSHASIVYNRKGKVINIVLLLLFMLYRSIDFLLISTQQQLLLLTISLVIRKPFICQTSFYNHADILRAGWL